MLRGVRKRQKRTQNLFGQKSYGAKVYKKPGGLTPEKTKKNLTLIFFNKIETGSKKFKQEVLLPN